MELKFVIVGDGFVGKTPILKVFTTNTFPGGDVPTVFDNYHKSITVDDVKVLISLTDTAGQEDYDRLRPLIYPNTDIFLVCFAVNNQWSLQNVYEKWIREINHHCPEVPKILVGTKTDLRYDPDTLRELAERKEKPVSQKEGIDMAKKIGAAKYVECSALNRTGIEDVFIQGVRVAHQNRQGGSQNRQNQPQNQGKNKRKCILL